MIQSDASMEITRNLLIALGLEIQKDTNVLYDQETKSPIFFEGSAIKANTDPSKGLFVNENDIKFEPLNPKYTKLMERFFGKFLDDAAENEYINPCSTYYFDRDEKSGKYRLTIKFEKKDDSDPEKWVGNWYINKVICYNEAIFTIDGTFDDIDLRPFDIDQNVDQEDDGNKESTIYSAGDEALSFIV